jgi:Holliday junction DNA helicase RuvA
MIVRLTGTLIEVSEDTIVVEHDGLAREVLVPRFSVGELASLRGRSVSLHTTEFFEGNPAKGHLIPRMLGFSHPEDRLFFSRFVNVKGMGPRKALKALTEPVRRIATWIESGDVKALARLPGIGQRGAELIVASLKGKMGDLALPPEGGAPARPVDLSNAQRDALEVLVAWGDARNDAERWLERASQLHPDVDDASEWVRLAYRIKSGMEG